MPRRTIVPVLTVLAAVLALAACGEDQTARQPAGPSSPPAAETARAPSPPASGGATATAPPESTGAVQPGPGTSTTTQTAAAPAGTALNIERLHNRTYTAGPVSLRLNPDNTFVMNEVEGNRKVEGRYAFENGIVTFSEPKGDIGPAQFPMRCRLEENGAEFRLAETEATCTRFKDLTFKPAAG